MEYELTGDEKLLVTWMVNANQRGELEKRFRVLWLLGGGTIEEYNGSGEIPQLLPDNLDSLEEEGLLRCRRNTQTKTSTHGSKKPKITEREVEVSRGCTITEEAQKAVESGFVKPNPEPPQPSVINQTNNFYAEVNYSAIGPNSHVELTQNLNLGAVRERIDKDGDEYAEDLHELLDIAESASCDGKALEPGALSEFRGCASRQRGSGRYRQILWIDFSDHAATFSSVPSTSSPFLNSAPALTSATR